MTAGRPLEIGSRIEMFIDEHLVARKDNARLLLHPAAMREIVLSADVPWQGTADGFWTVLRDHEGKFRLYYRAWPGNDPGDENHVTFSCLAVSEDGIHFTRPRLGLFEFEGRRENNIIWQGVDSHTFAPFLDTNPDVREDELYKAVARQRKDGDDTLIAFVSPDGVNWRRLRAEPIITSGLFDTHNVAFWDGVLGAYRCYTRYYFPVEGERLKVRGIQSSVSDDFRNWTEPVPNAYPEGTLPEHLYTNAVAPCPGAEHHLLSFPKRFSPLRKRIAEHDFNGASEAIFMSSRDGVNWDRSFMEAWVRPGLDQRNWLDRNNMIARGVLELPGEPESFSLYISQHYHTATNHLKRLTVRRHGFASMHAGYAPGEFTTHALRGAPGALHLNYSTAATGSVQVEVQDENFQHLPGFGLDDMQPLYGDSLDETVHWQGGSRFGDFGGRPVRLRFVLKDADIFALHFGAQ